MGEKRRAARVPQPVPPGIFLRICAREGLPQRVQRVKSSKVPPELAQVARTEATNKSTVQSITYGAHTSRRRTSLAIRISAAAIGPKRR